MSVSCSSLFNEVYGGVGYVFTERKYSDILKEMTINAFRNKFGSAFQEEDITPERFKTGDLWRVGLRFFRLGGVQTEINRMLSGME